MAAALIISGPASAGDDDKRGDHQHRWSQKPTSVQLGPRPYFLVDDMSDGALKRQLKQCTQRTGFTPREFSIGHRGAALQFPEHTAESYMAAARMGAGIVECDVSILADGNNGFYYQTFDAAIKTEGDMMQVLDVLARQVGILGIFSDWPATTTFYANCAGLR